MGGDKAKIEELVDLSSFIDMFILEELSKDCDAGRASFFVKKDPGGKLCCTAPWDFDFGFGTYGPAVSPYGFACQSGDNPCEWYASLVEQTWFREAVTARIKELSPAFKATLEAGPRKGGGAEGGCRHQRGLLGSVRNELPPICEQSGFRKS